MCSYTLKPLLRELCMSYIEELLKFDTPLWHTGYYYLQDTSANIILVGMAPEYESTRAENIVSVTIHRKLVLKLLKLRLRDMRKTPEVLCLTSR